uniref:Uncharacterized protein n=1 Tax=Rhizophora mucronata TaxID=61149 RepID=A0A2P2NWN1_RHIMU
MGLVKLFWWNKLIAIKK